MPNKFKQMKAAGYSEAEINSVRKSRSNMFNANEV